MKRYIKTWKNRVEAGSSTDWTHFPNRMSLKINEDSTSTAFIAASMEFNGRKLKKERKRYNGSLYYKILVNGSVVSEYHVIDPIHAIKNTEVNLHGVSEIQPGENTIEVQYKLAKNGSWEILRNLGQRNLSVLTVPSK